MEIYSDNLWSFVCWSWEFQKMVAGWYCLDTCSMLLKPRNTWHSDTRQQWLPGVRTHDTQPEKTIDDPHYLSVTRRRLQHKVQGTPSHSPRRLYKHMWGCGGGGSEEMIFMSPENFGNEMRNKIAHIPIILSTSCPHNCQCSLLTDNMTLKSRLSGEQTSSITRAVSQF